MSKFIVSEKTTNLLFTHYRNLIVLTTLAIASIWAWQQPFPTSLVLRSVSYLSLSVFSIYVVYLLLAAEANLAAKVPKHGTPVTENDIPPMLWGAHILSLAAIIRFITMITAAKL